MAISRHKVLSEMQQQLELASSKCGNLQKQLEIVKDKVKNSSTTNHKEPPDEKENNVRNGDVMASLIEVEKNQEYQRALSISSSSSENVNDEENENIIKVFYERLGQMDYPKHNDDLSDISSVDNNDLDINQLLSSVNFPVSKHETTEQSKRKEKRKGKKIKERQEKKNLTQKVKNTKGRAIPKISTPNPYENQFTNTLRSSPVKTKNIKNKQKPKDGNENNFSAKSASAKKCTSRGQLSKFETKMQKKKKQSGILMKNDFEIIKNNSRKAFQEPIKRIMNLNNVLRKTKSTTEAEKKDNIPDSRSLTRLFSGMVHEVNQTRPNLAQETPHKNMNSFDKELEYLKEEIINITKKPIAIVNKGKPKTKKKCLEDEIIAATVEKGDGTRIVEDKGKPISDQQTMAGRNKLQKLQTVQLVKTQVGVNKTTKSVKQVQREKSSIAKKVDSNAKPTSNEKNLKILENKPHNTDKTLLQRKVPDTKNIDSNPEKNKMKKNGVILHSDKPVTKLIKSDVKQKVNLFEGALLNDKIELKEPKLDLITNPIKKAYDKRERITGKFGGSAMSVMTPISKSTLRDDESRKEQDSVRALSSINIVRAAPMVRSEIKEIKEPEISPITVNQIKRMKDNLMKFNAIPFIVGQSTAKSYHIGLNIQQTYSLFKQTPSITALRVSKVTDGDVHSIHSRARSARTYNSGHGSKGRDICPACDPVPDLSPEQLADPWAVPQDDERAIIPVCTCLPKRIISFDQVLNQLYFTDINLVKFHPNHLPNRNKLSSQAEEFDSKEKSEALLHRGTNTVHYTKLLRSIQNLKDNILG